MFKESKILQNCGDNINITYMRYKAPWPVSDRDMIVIGGIVTRKEKTYFIASSVEY